MMHFTAHIEVHQVDEGEEPKPDQYNPVKMSGGRPRQVNDVARIVVRADTLDALQVKVAKHIALIE